MTGPGAQMRHVASFLLVGLGSFGVDLGLLLILRHGLGLSPFVARVPAIGAAMVVGWLCNRTFTFRAAAPPHLAEFLRYAAASGLAVSVNYATFAGLLLARPATPLALAAFIGSGVAAGVSYAGYRLYAFRRP
jgi:putative flippase GtrA